MQKNISVYLIGILQRLLLGWNIILKKPKIILEICYMNTSGRIKAMTGAQGGAVCTSSSVKKIFEWGLKQHKKILFIPDKYMGENVAYWLNIPKEKIAYWPAGYESQKFKLEE